MQPPILSLPDSLRDRLDAAFTAPQPSQGYQSRNAGNLRGPLERVLSAVLFDPALPQKDAAFVQQLTDSIWHCKHATARRC